MTRSRDPTTDPRGGLCALVAGGGMSSRARSGGEPTSAAPFNFAPAFACPAPRSLSTHVVHSTATPSPLFDLSLISVLIYTASWGGYPTYLSLLLLSLYLKSKSSTVLNESVLAIAGLGLQLSTTRGLLLPFPTSGSPLRIPLSTSRLFLPLASISDVVINEGISGWTIIYYLVIIQDEGKGPVKLRVGFPELLPRLEELRKVWTGVRATLFNELEEERS